MEGRRRRFVWSVCAVAVVAGTLGSLLWSDPASTQVIVPGWRCYPAKLPKGAPKFVETDVVLNGTLQGSVATAIKPAFYCDRVDQGLNSTSSPPLVCYKIKDVKGTPKFPGAQPSFTDPLLHVNATLDLKSSKLFCVQAQ